MAGVIPVPKSIVESRTSSGTLIVCRWECNPLSLGIFALAYLGLVGFLTGELMFGSNALCLSFRESNWLVKVLIGSPVLLVIVAGFLLIASFWNHTDVRVTESKLEIEIRPIPWRCKRTIAISEISQLLVREKVTNDSYGRITKSYDLHWIDSFDQCRPLIRWLRVHEALYLENRLEEILGIEDQPVSGAFAGYKFYQ